MLKYRSKIEGLHTQKNLKNDQYPKTLVHATDALSNYSFYNKYYKRRQKKCQDKARKRKQDDENEDNKSFAQKDDFSAIVAETRHIHQPSVQRRVQDQRMSG